MTTITIELTDEQAQAIAQEAARLQVTPEELAIQRLLAPLPPSAAPNFQEAMEYVLHKNAELYRRLA